MTTLYTDFNQVWKHLILNKLWWCLKSVRFGNFEVYPASRYFYVAAYFNILKTLIPALLCQQYFGKMSYGNT